MAWRILVERTVGGSPALRGTGRDNPSIRLPGCCGLCTGSIGIDACWMGCRGSVDPGKKGQAGDIGVFVDGDLGKSLTSIKCKVLVMPSRTDQYFP